MISLSPRSKVTAKQLKVASLLSVALHKAKTITRKAAIALVHKHNPDIEERHIDKWAVENTESIQRGVWVLKAAPEEKPTSTPKPPPVGVVTSRRKSGPRMAINHRQELAKVVAGAMFLETPKPIPQVVEDAARALGLTKVPGNVIATITPDYQREYEALVTEAITDKPVVVTERLVLDLTQAHPLDLLREVLRRGADMLREIESLRVNPTVEQNYLSTTTTPKPRAKQYRVLITGLLPSQVADMKNRPKIKANADRLDLHFLTQDSTTLRIPHTADLVLSFRKMRHALWHSLNAHYGREKVQVHEGMHGIEEALMTGLSQWANS